MSAPFREDLVALLEECPHSPRELAAWIPADPLTITRELRALEQLGVVARQDGGSAGIRWVLTGTPLPPETLTGRRAPKALRQPKASVDTSGAAPSWWCDAGREEFSERARQEFDARLSKQKLPRNLYPNQRDGGV